jgi:hypothetical protein
MNEVTQRPMAPWFSAAGRDSESALRVAGHASGCGAEMTGARTCGLRACVGKASMDFSLSDLRFIVAVWSFFGFNVRVLDSLINAPRSNSRPLEIEAELHGCGV